MTVEEAAERIRRGDVVAFPTETVYGLGAGAWNPDAIKKIFKIKGRPPDNPLIIHLDNRSQAEEFAAFIPGPAHKLMEQCWPGPLTLVFQKKPEVLDAVTSGLDTVALRIPDHPVALELIRLAGPVAAPSANLSGRPSPTRAGHVRRDFGSGFPVLEGGDSSVGLESTVLDVSTRPFAVLRPGKYTFGELSEISGVEVIAEQLPGEAPRSPGVKYTHYMPEATVSWFRVDTDRAPGREVDIDKDQSADEKRSDHERGGMDDSDNVDTGRDERGDQEDFEGRRKRDERAYEASDSPDPQKTLLITHSRRPEGFPHHQHFDGDFEELARQLYDLFRMADYQNLTRILIEPLPPVHAHPLIAALKNRIEKASRES